MEEFLALAARVAASVRDLRGVLILSRDGLVLGAFPEGDEALIKPAWLRFAGLGEPEKGFVEFADELWVYVRRGPYASFAVSGSHARPGLVMDQLEQMLLAAEEVRAKREIRVPDAAPAPSGKPRTSLHPDTKPTTQPAAVEGGPVRPGPPQAAPPPARPGVVVGGAYAAAQPPGPQPPAPSIAALPASAARATPVPPSSAPATPAAPKPAAGPAAPASPARDVSGPPSAPSPAPATDGGPERPPADGSRDRPPPDRTRDASMAEPAPERPPSAAPQRAGPQQHAHRSEPAKAEPGPPRTPESPPPGEALQRESGDPADEPVAPIDLEVPVEEEGEIDAVLLAQEFSRLLQETGDGDET
jgi:hypothetical protein